MLAMLGLAKKAELRPLQLSGGEKQRVAIGRALIKQPAFVFADEPTSALDWKHGQHVIELLRAAAHDQGSTILVVAHDSRIIPFVDRVLHLEDGILYEGAEKPMELSAIILCNPAINKRVCPFRRSGRALSQCLDTSRPPLRTGA